MAEPEQARQVVGSPDRQVWARGGRYAGDAGAEQGSQDMHSGSVACSWVSALRQDLRCSVGPAASWALQGVSIQTWLCYFFYLLVMLVQKEIVGARG